MLLTPVSSVADEHTDFDNRDWAGMRRDLYYLIGWQVVATAIIYNAPFEVSNWSEDEKDNLGFDQWRDNVTDVVWDEDHWAINYVVHPYWGAGYYIRGRERGFNRKESFWISVLYSTVYEFGIESFLEQPSIQDIIVTPLAGTALGLYFENVRGRIRSKPGPMSIPDKMKMGLTDPLGALNRGVNRLFRIDESDESQLMIGFRLVRPQPYYDDFYRGRPIYPGRRGIDGFEISFRYNW